MADSAKLFAQAYQDSHGEWRWRLKHRNGNVLSDSGEGYQNRHDMLEVLFNLHPGIDIDYLDESGRSD